MEGGMRISRELLDDARVNCLALMRSELAAQHYRLEEQILMAGAPFFALYWQLPQQQKKWALGS
jgi:hypothetical protein